MDVVLAYGPTPVAADPAQDPGADRGKLAAQLDQSLAAL